MPTKRVRFWEVESDSKPKYVTPAIKVVSPEWEALAKASQKRLEKRVKNG